MGFDVYGLNPYTERGEYFRRNVWGWRPLWNYIVEVCPNETYGIDGHSNSGDQCDAIKAARISNTLFAKILNGEAEAYVHARDVYLESLPLVECSLCESTGVRSDSIGVQQNMPTRKLEPSIAAKVGRTTGWCNGCDGVGEVASTDTWYRLRLDDIIDFAEFAQASGGFEIF